MLTVVVVVFACVKAHPTHQYFAAAECGIHPDINVFEYPSLKLYRILKGGAERSYVNMAFRYQ